MMHYLNNKKKNNAIVTSTALFTIVTLVIAAASSIGGAAVNTAVATTTTTRLTANTIEPLDFRKAPVVVSGDNIYIAWWTNNTENGNQEVMFRASNDAGATFSDKINLSNTTEADSWRVETHGEADTVVVSWWETNQTSDTPVARLSSDGGQTFGPVLRLAANGTIASTEEGEGGEEGE
jgi:hypothetical protein